MGDDVGMAEGEWRLGYRAELDGLRGVAIALVLLLHWWPDTFPGGRIGVDLFFVLSGFLITTLMIEDGQLSLTRFYERRARRLLPPVAVFLALFWWADGAMWVALYVGNWARAVGELSPYLAHTWSLAIEEQFYVAWPLLFLALRRYPRWIVAGVLFGTALLVGLHRTQSLGDAHRLVNGTDTRMDGLAIGCAVAFGLPWLLRIPWGALAIASLGPLAYVFFVDAILWGWGYTLVSAGWAIVLLAVLQGRAAKLLAHPSLVWLGVLSYSLYLWHYPIAVAVESGDIGLPHNLATTVGMIVASFAVALASHRWIETPFRRRSRTSGHLGGGEVGHGREPASVSSGAPVAAKGDHVARRQVQGDGA